MAGGRRGEVDLESLQLRILELESNIAERVHNMDERSTFLLASRAIGQAQRALASGELAVAHEYLERARFLMGLYPGHSHETTE